MIKVSRPRVLSTRRLILLATVANLGLVAAVAAPSGFAQTALPTAATAQTNRPVGFADIVERTKPAVVSVRVKLDAAPKMTGLEGDGTFRLNPRIDRFFHQFGMPDAAPDQDRPEHRSVTGQGSGFFITADGYAVTNNHVVDTAKTVEVTTDDGKIYEAHVIGTDKRTDLALIKVDGHTDFPHVKLAEKAPRIGDWVLAVGNPFGLGGTVTAGIVSARGRDIGAGPYDDFIQIDAPVNKGNSGGPSFDMEGNVIGVNTAIVSPSGGSVGIAFDIPADTVRAVVDQLKEKGSVSRGWIGVQVQPLSPEIADGLGLKETQGALVVEPQAEGPAAKAGLMSGDVITAVEGKPVKDARDLARQVGALAAGTTAKVTVLRKGEEKSFALTVGELPNQREARAAAATGADATHAPVPKLGLRLAPAGEIAGAGSDGVVVTDVDPDGLAAERGVKEGDVVLDVGGQKVASAADVRNALGDAAKSGKHTVLVRLKSDGTTKFIAIPLARA